MSHRGYCDSGGYGTNPNVNININVSPHPRRPDGRQRHTERDFYEMQAAALENAHAYERERRLRREEQLLQQLRLQEQQNYAVQPRIESGRDGRTRLSRSATHGPSQVVSHGQQHTQRRLANSDGWPGLDIPTESRDVGLERQMAERRMSERRMGPGGGMPSRRSSRVSQLEAQSERRMGPGGGVPGRTGSRLSQLGVRFDGNVRV